MQLRSLKGLAGIEAVRGQWIQLAERQRVSTLLQFPEYYESYAQTLARNPDAFRCIAVFRGEQLIALFPLQKTTERVGPLNICILEFPNTPCPRRDVIIDPGEELSDVIRFLQKSLQTNADTQWDLMKLTGVPDKSALTADGSLARGTLRLCRSKGYNNVQDLSQSDLLEDHLPPRLVRNLRARRRNLNNIGNCEFITADSYSEHQEAFKEFLDVEASGWKSQRGGKRAIKLHKHQVAFYSDLMKRYANHRGCRIHLLKLNSQTIAANFCICVNDTCYSLKSGFDEDYSKVAPGQLLREHVLNYYLSDPDISYFDLIADYEWQRHWRPRQRRVFDLYFFNPTTIKGLILYCLMGMRMRLQRFRQRH
jgi:CelD/BcsL family acetyltransferase involved in cellulose biosynthesis